MRSAGVAANSVVRTASIVNKVVWTPQSFPGHNSLPRRPLPVGSAPLEKRQSLARPSGAVDSRGRLGISSPRSIHWLLSCIAKTRILRHIGDGTPEITPLPSPRPPSLPVDAAEDLPLPCMYRTRHRRSIASDVEYRRSCQRHDTDLANLDGVLVRIGLRHLAWRPCNAGLIAPCAQRRRPCHGCPARHACSVAASHRRCPPRHGRHPYLPFVRPSLDMPQPCYLGDAAQS
ncbi:hypothetical protein C8F04DRAFT_1096005 [Mycena alexandri]|uniref:Uncharacterized protein n=1 Tax=Mycena alexandri TaxID=1745969 RepID=A0AAD6X4E6_9AGAR|nr:hypothetical protein C8F04DRAFT_1096005 [Mycena alexandri]